VERFVSKQRSCLRKAMSNSLLRLALTSEPFPRLTNIFSRPLAPLKRSPKRRDPVMHVYTE
jgi:hypothetical protein